MSTRLEFVLLARAPSANIRGLCDSFNISPKTGYKWLKRYEAEGEVGLADRSRAPIASPTRSVDEVELLVLTLHQQFPCWGSRKLFAMMPADRYRPHPSTIDAILRRHGRQVEGGVHSQEKASTRFEHPAANILWQMDFKGHFALSDRGAGRCHPLTILDDYSRFNLCLAACGDEQGATVKAAMTRTFRRFGLPNRITADNGPPWGTMGRQGLSALEAWLICLGIDVSHSRPYHPQTQGKDERFHRTLKLEVIGRQGFHSLQACQVAFDDWRNIYNQVRPHQALGQQPPMTRYQPSGRAFPNRLPMAEYLQDDRILKVRPNGQILLRKREYFIGEGLKGQRIALRQTNIDGILEVYYFHRKIREIDLTQKA